MAQLTREQMARLQAVYDVFPTERLQPYLKRCGLSTSAALDLYRWNSQVSAALYEVLGHFEVSLRNLLDEALGDRHLFKKRPGDWLDDTHREFSARASDVLAKAQADGSHIAHSRQSSRESSRGHTIAELNLSFWRRLLDPKYERIWGSAVMRKFPAAFKPKTNDDMSSLRQIIDPILLMRNRIAHHEPIWYLNHAARRDDMLRIIEVCGPDCADWVRGSDRLDAVLAESPILRP